MPSIDLSPIPLPPTTTLSEVRTSKMRPLGSVLSGIDKQPRMGPLRVSSTLGLPDDEHDLTFHGGVDKAVHQYCTDHYVEWRSLFPEEPVRSRFVPGGFGENLVARGWDERCVCIGDLVRIGYSRGDEGNGSGSGSGIDSGHGGSSGNGSGSDEDDGGRDEEDDDDDDDDGRSCLLEVSLPRQPCFKLNQRFGIKNFAPQTHQKAMTGWYYRVKREGVIEAGMTMRVVRRNHPRWSIARLHHYVHRDRLDLDICQELMKIKVMGNECRNVFENRWEQHLAKEKKKQKLQAGEAWMPYKVASKTMETPRIVRLSLQSSRASRGSTNVSPPAPIPVGSYAVIKLPNGLRRTYSVVSGTEDCFVLGVARDDHSRGGSVYIHDQLRVGDDTVLVSAFDRGIEFSGMASHAIFIVGGIGITAFLAGMKRRVDTNQSLELHYAVRTAEDVAFAHILTELAPNDVKIYDKTKGQRIDIPALLAGRPWNSHVYTCGPSRMIDAVVAAAEALGMPKDEVHYESFSTADSSGDPFKVKVERSQNQDQDLGQGQGRDQNRKNESVILNVESDQSLLEAMREAGFDVASSCEAGNCGTCRVLVRSGEVLHRGTGLTEDEKKEGEMLACVSRGVGEIVVEV